MHLKTFMKKSLFCNRYNHEDTIILTSSPRSGSTWLAHMWQEYGYDLIDEPLRLSKYPEAKKFGFEWRTYISPHDDDERRLEYMKNILIGNVGLIRHSREYFSFLATPKFLKKCKLIVKFVRANRMLAWITTNFSIHCAILLIRHPCAVVSSQIAMGERQDGPWKYSTKNRVRNVPYSYGGTIPEYILDKYSQAFDKVKSRAGYLAVVWALDNLIPLFIHPPSNTIIVSYELLMSDPISEFERINSEIGIMHKYKNLNKFIKPSMTASPDLLLDNSTKQISKWKKQLSSEEILEIMNIVDSFGFCFYSEDPMPDIRFFQKWHSDNSIR